MTNSSPAMALSDAEPPKGFDFGEYQKTYREFHKRTDEYRKRNVTRNDYLTREFVAWDGEGFNADPRDGSTHRYALLANSDGLDMRDYFGLGTEAVFTAMLGARKGVINIGYGLNYDLNMILRDVDKESLIKLYEEGWVVWNRFRINWRPGKSFSLERNNLRFLIYDVLPFFQRSFISACDEYLGKEWPGRDRIIQDKARRGSFTWEEIDSVGEYNNLELINLVALGNELRTRLDRVGIRVSRWDGPGAIATALFQRYQTKTFMKPTPKGVNMAARYAYAGGRFELIRQGHSDRPVWEYDINSAYPEAIAKLPCLAHGRWRKVKGRPDKIAKFGVYHIKYNQDNDPLSNYTNPQPLWTRAQNGTICYAWFVNGWYWSPEADNVFNNPGATFVEGWEWNQTCNHEPFDWVPQLYNKRAALKKAEDGAHVGLKLGLNSLYGKLAQQIGAKFINGEWRIPPYHCLEWAGWVTSHCRAKVWNAIQGASDDVIAFETDAVFTRVPLDHLSLSNRLGDWEETRFDNLTYFKSGFYFGDVAGEEVEKSRGINKGSVTRQTVIHALQNRNLETAVVAEQTRFITLGQALNQTFEKWRSWSTDPRVLKTTIAGTKRLEIMTDWQITKPMGDGWEETIPFSAADVDGKSHPYPVVWSEDGLGFTDPEGRDMNAFRRDDYDGESDAYYP